MVSPSDGAARAESTVFDDVAYWLTILSTYFLVGVLFGQTSTGNNEGTASLFTYFGITAIVMLLVMMLPPNRPRDWLSGFGSR
jgi:hypothetical protein